MTSPRAPVPGTRLGIGLAVRALPTPADRERYFREVVAELYGLPPASQLRHVAGFLSQAVALRAALGASPSRGIQEVGMRPATTAGQRFRCRYLHWHYWRQFSADDGARYTACAVCRKEHQGWDGPERLAAPGPS